ncbi:hypothetical protein I6J77_17310 [Rhodanobacter sp. FDAARGOS 1247]|uniref:hypothetical protein n=1 Tax=Rhodanobacter sp. FDAARGOS 1247 TaxID=2778082 RepID=UPI00194FF097|nr:hypothetical protein [Rhodanobacter sp. FDAARGOS 1247]QRP63826.1 hypothetical protein I6J77_17310 [Rhodanobacter sp. FDAARGOS 1247]
MTDLRQLREIAAQLRELQRTSPTAAADILAWDASARRFSESLDVALPPEVMHYLHDADIRVKDPGYRVAQDKAISGIIADLEAGILPQTTALGLSFHPRWLGALALIVLVIISWAVVR